MPEVDKKQPALIGGLIVGVLSSLPVVNIGNYCCCLWALLGGALAAKLLIDRSPQPVKPGDGAAIGAMAGGIGAVISLIIGIPLSLVMGPAMFGMMRRLADLTSDPNAQQALERMIAKARRRRRRNIHHSIPRNIRRRIRLPAILAAGAAHSNNSGQWSVVSGPLSVVSKQPGKLNYLPLTTDY